MEKIEKTTLDFISGLQNNNERDWFNNNRKLYENAKMNFESFIQALIVNITEFDPILKGLEAKSCIYRINRDTRFSNDKSPYKTNFGAFIVRGGRKNGDKFAGYYIHVEPGKSMIAGGAYMPPSPWLTSIRDKIADQPQVIKEILNDKDFRKYFKELEGDKLKKAPKGYPPDHPEIELLKFKSYLAVNEISDKQVLDSLYLDFVVKNLFAMKPLNDFLNEI
jgi:uncharacterized protein (TIGR02453 family)